MGYFVCCSCGRKCAEHDHGSSLTGRYLDTVNDDKGEGVLVFCRECWDTVRTSTENKAKKDGFERGAQVLRCAICGEAIPVTVEIPQGILFAGTHENRDIHGALKTSFCSKCWERIMLNVLGDMAAALEGEINVSYS